MATIYLAGGLFNAGERLHNLMLERELIELGHEVILPQREAVQFIKDGVADVAAIAQDCAEKCRRTGVVYVGSSDGADADSGTCVELGLHLGSNWTARTVVYRTDFRTALENEVGVNAMLQLRTIKFVYEPCFYTELTEVDAYYEGLAAAIDKAIRPTE